MLPFREVGVRRRLLTGVKAAHRASIGTVRLAIR